jgi:hypothetical protein
MGDTSSRIGPVAAFQRMLDAADAVMTMRKIGVLVGVSLMLGLFIGWVAGACFCWLFYLSAIPFAGARRGAEGAYLIVNKTYRSSSRRCGARLRHRPPRRSWIWCWRAKAAAR